MTHHRQLHDSITFLLLILLLSMLMLCCLHIKGKNKKYLKILVLFIPFHVEKFNKQKSLKRNMTHPCLGILLQSNCRLISIILKLNERKDKKKSFSIQTLRFQHQQVIRIGKKISSSSSSLSDCNFSIQCRTNQQKCFYLLLNYYSILQI